MSNTVDERVVSMQFNNKNFENNVNHTISSLDKLKASLNFNSSAKGLDQLGAKIGNVNMSGLGSAVESVSLKFSTMQMVAMSAINKIVGQAVDAGERLVKSLSIDQINAGWDRYAEKTSAVQTIMAATAKDFTDTGEQMEFVNEQLEKLSWFTDETSYKFLDMVQNIGKFTSNNVKLENAVTAMEGISTWAAISGANTTEAGRAMYNLSQAMATGSVKLIDWKSIENANMATFDFKQNVIDTAVELGTLTKEADGLYKTLDNNTLSAVKDFNNTLQDGWFTSDVLIATLKKYGDFTDELNKACEEIGATATEMLGYIEEYAEGTLDLNTIAEETGTSVEYLSETLKKLSSEEFSLGKRSFQAAQEAKTFKEAIDATKEAVSSGWMKVFENIFGSYTEAKKLWTDLANTLYDVFVEPVNSLNELLSGAFGKKSGNLKTIEKAKELLSSYGDSTGKINSVMDKTKTTFAEFAQVFEDVEKLSDEVINGQWTEGRARLQALTDAGYNYYRIQNRVNEKLGSSVRSSQAMIDAQDKLLNRETQLAEVRSGELEQATELSDAQKEEIKRYARMQDWQLQRLKLDKQQISSIRDIKSLAEELGITTDELVDNVDNLNARFFFLRGIKNIGNSLIKILDIAKESFRDIFPSKTAEDIFNLTVAFNKFTNSLIIGSRNAQKLKDTFDGLFALIDIVKMIFTGPLKAALTIANSLFKTLGLGVLDVTSALGKGIVGLRDWMKENLNFTQAFENFGKAIGDVVLNIKNFIESFKSIKAGPKEIVKLIFDSLKGLGSALINLIKDIFSKLFNISRDESEEIGKNFMQGFLVGIKNFATKIFDAIVNFGKTVLEKIRNVWGIHSPAQKVIEIMKHFFDGFEVAFKTFAPRIYKIFKAFGENFLDIFKDTLPNVWGKIKEFFSKIGSKYKDVSNPIIDFVKGAFGKVKDFISKIDFGDVIGTGLLIALIALSFKIVKIIKTVTSTLPNLLESLDFFLVRTGAAIKKVANSLSAKLISEAVRNLAISFAILTASLTTLALFGKENLKPVINAFLVLSGVLAGFIVIIGALSIILLKMSGIKGEGLAKFAIAITSISLLLISFVAAMAIMSKLKSQGADIKGSISTIAIFTAAVSALMVVIGIIERKHLGSNYAAFAGVATIILSMAICMKVIKNLNSDDIIEGIIAINAFGLFISIMMLAMSRLKFTTKNAGKAILSIGGLILMMTGVILILRKLTPEEVETGTKILAVITGLAGGMVLLSSILELVAGKTKLKGTSALKDLAACLLTLTSVLAAIQLITKEGTTLKDLLEAFKIIGVLALIATGLLAATRIVAGQEFKKIGMTLMGVVGAISMLAVLTIILGKLDSENLKKGLIFTASLSAMIALMLFALKKVQNSFKTLLMLTILVTVLAGIMVAFKYLKPEESIKSVLAFNSMIIAMSILFKSLEKISKNKIKLGNLMKIVLALTSLAVTLVAFAGAVKLIELIDISETDYASLWNLIGVISVFTVLSKVLSKMKTTAKLGNLMKPILALTSLAGVLVVFAGALYLINKMDINETDYVSLLNLIGVIFVFTLLTKALSKMKTTAKLGNVMKPILALTSLAGVLVVFAFAVKAIEWIDISENVVNVLWNLVGVISVFTLLSKVLSELKTTAKIWNLLKPIVALTALAVTLVAFAGAVYVINKLDISDTDYLSIWNLVGVVTVFALLSERLAKLKTSSNVWDLIKPVIALTALAGTLVTFGGAIRAIKWMNISDTDYASLWNLIGVVEAFALLSWGLSKLKTGANIWNLIKPIVALTALAGTLTTFGAAVKLIEIMNISENVINVLWNLVGAVAAFSVLSLILAKVGNTGWAAIKGAAIVSVVIGIFIGLATLFGWLESNNDSFKEFRDVGSEILIGCAENLGKAIAAFADPINESVLGLLPKLGTSLNDFIINLEPGLKVLEGVSYKSVLGATYLATAIAGLSIGEITAAITSFGGIGMKGFGTRLSDFAEALDPFIVEMSKVDPNMALSTVILTTAIAELGAANLADSISNILDMLSLDGLKKLFGSKDTESPFAKLGQGIADFNEKIKDSSINSAKVKECAESINILAGLDIPRSDGLLQKLIGEKDTNSFGTALGKLGEGLATFEEKTKNIVLDNITNGCTALTKVSSACKDIPNDGGLWGLIIGNNAPDEFGTDLETLASGLKTFSLTSVEIDTDGIELGCAALTDVSSACKDIPNSGGFWGFIVGNNIETFGLNLITLGDGLYNFSWSCGSVNINSVETGCTALVKIANAAKNMPKQGGVESWFVSDQDMGKLGRKLKKLGNGLTEFAKSVATISEDQWGAAERAASTINYIAQAMSASNGLSASNIDNIDLFLEKMSGINFDNLKALLSAQVLDFEKMGENYDAALGEGMKKKKSSILSVIRKMFGGTKNSIFSVIKIQRQGFVDRGMEAIDGYIEGLTNSQKREKLSTTAEQIGKDAIAGIDKGQDSHSPSKKAEKSGKNLVLGYIRGIKDFAALSTASGIGIGEETADALAETIKNIADAFDEDADYEPVIRPVLDLSNVEYGVNQLNSMIGKSSAVVAGNANITGYNLSKANQNGMNDDVVSAINGLKDAVLENAGDTYQIGEINYSDDASVQQAVSDLIHAIKLERRT